MNLRIGMQRRSLFIGLWLNALINRLSALESIFYLLKLIPALPSAFHQEPPSAFLIQPWNLLHAYPNSIRNASGKDSGGLKWP